MTNAFARSGGTMPREVVSLAEFTDRFRAYPDIEGIVMGCVNHQSAEDNLVLEWIEELSLVLSFVRQDPPG